MVTITFFNFSTLKNKWWAFGQMGQKPFQTAETEGLTFAKMLGTGGGNGFSIRPNFGQYVWLGVWTSESAARNYLAHHPLSVNFKGKTDSHWSIFLQPIKAHGRWGGIAPFNCATDFKLDRPIAVLTRARIKPTQMWRFWRYVPSVSRSIEPYSERVLSVGIGELPFIEQATFSLWTSGKAMMDYAYQNPLHAEMVRKTRSLGWYSEELFARFEVVEVEGNDAIRQKLF